MYYYSYKHIDKVIYIEIIVLFNYKDTNSVIHIYK